MPTSKGIYYPAWCVEVHSSKALNEDSLTIHWKGFGNLPGEEASLVKVWVAFDESKMYSSSVEVDVLETYWADDLRILSKDCLEAAAWMEENLRGVIPVL